MRESGGMRRSGEHDGQRRGPSTGRRTRVEVLGVSRFSIVMVRTLARAGVPEAALRHSGAMLGHACAVQCCAAFSIEPVVSAAASLKDTGWMGQLDQIKGLRASPSCRVASCDL